jgi:hypothetical protein
MGHRFDMVTPGVNPTALRAALWYEIECEKFDRTLPGGFSKHDPETWIPAGAYGESSRNALRLRDKLDSFCNRAGISYVEERRARETIERMPFSHQVELADEMDRQAGKTFELEPRIELVRGIALPPTPTEGDRR